MRYKIVKFNKGFSIYRKAGWFYKWKYIKAYSLIEEAILFIRLDADCYFNVKVIKITIYE